MAQGSAAKTKLLICNPLVVCNPLRLRRRGGVRGLSEMSQAGKIWNPGRGPSVQSDISSPHDAIESEIDASPQIVLGFMQS